MIKLPENLYSEMLKFFRKTSLPRIKRQRALQKAVEEKIKAQAVNGAKDTPAGNNN